MAGRPRKLSCETVLEDIKAGYTRGEIAARHKCTQQTVTNRVREMRRNGVEVPVIREAPLGRKPKITLETVRAGLAAGLTPNQLAERAGAGVDAIHARIRQLRDADPAALRVLGARPTDVVPWTIEGPPPTDLELHDAARHVLGAMLTGSAAVTPMIAAGAKLVFEHVPKPAPTPAVLDGEGLLDRVKRATRTAEDTHATGPSIPVDAREARA